jgi:hypothetical protein
MSKSLTDAITSETFIFDATAIIPITLKIKKNNFNEALKMSGLANNNLSIKQVLIQFVLQDGSIVTPTTLDFDISIDNIDKE